VNNTSPNTNPLKIKWPQDKTAMTLELKRGGCRAAGRIGGHDERLAVVLEVLETLAQLAKDKHAEQKGTINRKRSAAINKQKADADALVLARDGQINTQRQQIKEMTAVVAQHDIAKAALLPADTAPVKPAKKTPVKKTTTKKTVAKKVPAKAAE